MRKPGCVVWVPAAVLIAGPAGFSLCARYGLGLDIDLPATALRASVAFLAYLPVMVCLGWAASAIGRMRAGELAVGVKTCLKHTVLPAGLGLCLAVLLLPWAIERGLAVVVKVPTLQSLERFELFEDDRLGEKTPAFEPGLVDSRPFEGMRVNASAAVITLRIEKEEPGREQGFSKLYPSYAAAAAAWAAKKGERLLPSVNALDGKAKQFDDGLLAALHLAAAGGFGAGADRDVAVFLHALFTRLDPRGQAHAWVWAGLKVGGQLSAQRSALVPPGADGFVKKFRQAAGSQPYGFYSWSPELGQAYALLRYFQEELDPGDPRAVEIAGLLSRDPALRSRYTALLDWLASLETGQTRAGSLAELEGSKGRRRVSLLAAPLSKEDLLFTGLFGEGLPPGADLMLELVKAVRSGKLDLKPGAKAGWYEYQAYALETFLLPERGPESAKLLLDKEYKKRMLKAFAAVLAKRRETRALSGMFALGALAEGEDARPRTPLPPRLRVEPNPTYFLRMARSYAFLEDFLAATLSQEALAGLRGLREQGLRGMPLARELESIKRLFYGLHLLSCEDIGLRHQLLEGELESQAACLSAAEAWLSAWAQDADLAADTRIIVPVAHDPNRGASRLWATLGVHGARMVSYYARAPKWRRALREDAGQGWEDAPTMGASWIILVDDFVEFESKRTQAPTREEFRRVVDREGTKERIASALADGAPGADYQ